MTLDEAIKHCEEKAKELREQPLKEKMDIEDIAACEECAEEHEQLAEWLTELKTMKNCIKTECFKCAKDKATIDKAPPVDVIDKEKYDCLQESYRMLAEAYEYEVTKEETPQSRWTPVSEGLPEEKSYAMGYQDGAEDGLQGIRTEGKWIYHRARGEFLPYMECDNCHEEFLLNMLRPAEFRKVNRFCSYCGADMRGGEDNR